MALTLYWSVYPDATADYANDATDAAKLAAGQDSTGAALPVGAYGSQAYSAPGIIDASTAASGLTPGTAYRIAWAIGDAGVYGGGTSTYVVVSGVVTTLAEAVGGSSSAVEVSATGAGAATEVASGGSSSAVEVSATGAGSAQEEGSASGGSASFVEVAAAGAGTALEAAAGGNASTVYVTTAGAGTAVETATGGGSSVVAVSAVGGGAAQQDGAATGGSSSVVTVTSTGGGYAIEFAFGGSQSTVTVTSAGAGQAEESGDNQAGGSTSMAVVLAAGAGYATEFAVGGSSSIVQVRAVGYGFAPNTQPRVLSIFERMSATILRTLGKPAYYNGSTEPVMINIEHDVQMAGMGAEQAAYRGDYVANRDIATVPMDLNPRVGDRFVQDGVLWRLESLHSDKGANRRFVVSRVKT